MCENFDLKTNEVDDAWSFVYLTCFPLLVASVYIPLVYETQMMIFLEIVGKVRDCCKTNKLGGRMVLGDCNAKHTMWQFTKINKHRSLLDTFLTSTQSFSIVSPDVPTFSSFNGNSVIDLVLLFPKMKEKLKRHYIDDEAELFTGEARRGHVPVLSTLDLWPLKKEALTEVKQLYSGLGCLE